LGKFIIKRVSENGWGVATTTAEYASPKKDGIRLTLRNMYPGYKSTVDFGYRNDLTAPGRIESIDVTETEYPGIKITLGGLYLNRIIDGGREVPGSLIVVVDKTFKGTSVNQYTCSVRIKMCRLLECGLPSEDKP